MGGATYIGADTVPELAVAALLVVAAPPLELELELELEAILVLGKVLNPLGGATYACEGGVGAGAGIGGQAWPNGCW